MLYFRQKMTKHKSIEKVKEQTDEFRYYSDWCRSFGTFVGPSFNTLEEKLESKAIITVDSARKAIGRIVHQENVPAGKAYVAIISTVLKGGVPGSDPKHKTE